MKRVLLLLLAAGIVLSAVSCSEKQEDAGETEIPVQSDAPADAAAEEEPEYRYYEYLPEKDLGGMSFRIISRITAEGHDVQSFTDYGNNEIDAEEMDGTQINDTVYVRNRELENRYNFVFNSIQMDSNPMATVKTSILADSDDYDSVVDSIGSMADYTLLYNLNNLGTIELSDPCWDQNVNTSLSVGGKHYIAVGDMLILDKKGTWCLLFNKNLAADYQLENLYDLVREDKWTIDTFWSMVQLGSGDLNGDGIQDESDKWGFLTEGYNINILMFGCGNRLSLKDENDYPVIAAYDEHAVSSFEKAFEIMANRNYSLSMSWSKNGPADCLKAFSEDRGLFYMTGIGTAMEFRYMDSDFGIIPIPKYNEAQEQYYTSFSKFNSGCVGVPKSNQNPDDVGFLLQAICLASTTTLKTTFYDTVLSGVTVRDEESRDMLDIIFGGRVFDLAFINNWGSIGDLWTGLLGQNNSELASGYKSREKLIGKTMDKAIAVYQELE